MLKRAIRAKRSPAIETHLPANLRRLRTDAKLTSDQLAALSGVSRAMISKVERGVSVPTATVLGKLASALKVGLSQLLGEPQRRAPKLLEYCDQPVFKDPRSGFERRSLSPSFADRAVDVAFNTLPAGQIVSFPPHHAGVEEYLTVQQGTLTVVLQNKSFKVTEGSTLFYASDCAHAFRNDTQTTVTFFIVIDDRSKR